METIFWISSGLLVFIYAGYGPAIWLLKKWMHTNKEAPQTASEWPEVAVLIAAYNEEDVMEAKLLNTFDLAYPEDKLKVYVVSDGSDDQTNHIVARFPKAQLLWKKEREGKTSAINHAMRVINEPITVFTDANVMLNKEALVELVKHYSDEKTGCVSGEKRVRSESHSASSTEGIYWRYESFLKKQDADLNSLVGAAGELFSIRTQLYSPLPADTLLDDFMISMHIVQQGYRIAYEPNAFAIETPSLNIAEEYKRKVRIAAGGLQSVFRLKEFLNPFRYGLLSLQYILHRVSRWVLTPLLIPVSFFINLVLANGSDLYTFLFILQIVFHGTGLLGWILEKRRIRIKLFFIPFYFNFMHYCMMVGWWRYFSRRQKSTWQKAERLSISTLHN